MASTEMSVGGEGHVVEIDETSLKKKSKYGKGKCYPDVWLFGRVDRTTGKWFGVVTHDDRTKVTLSHLIRKHIKPGSIIMSDSFGSYVSSCGKHTLENNPLLKDMGYCHRHVNHTKNYVDPVTGAHTSTVEGVWEIRLKRFIKGMRGVNKGTQESYLQEYLWRSWHLPRGPKPMDALEAFVRCVI